MISISPMRSHRVKPMLEVLVWLLKNEDGFTATEVG